MARGYWYAKGSRNGLYPEIQPKLNPRYLVLVSYILSGITHNMLKLYVLLTKTINLLGDRSIC